MLYQCYLADNGLDFKVHDSSSKQFIMWLALYFLLLKRINKMLSLSLLSLSFSFQILKGDAFFSVMPKHDLIFLFMSKFVGISLSCQFIWNLYISLCGYIIIIILLVHCHQIPTYFFIVCSNIIGRTAPKRQTFDYWLLLGEGVEVPTYFSTIR